MSGEYVKLLRHDLTVPYGSIGVVIGVQNEQIIVRFHHKKTIILPLHHVELY
jgi:hypothetical protein